MKGAGSVTYYANLAHEDYYANHAGEPGQWFGTGATLLDLQGNVQRNPYHNLLLGFAPDGKQAMVQNAGHPNRQSCWDLTFSAPKSVSVLWGLSSDETRKQIESAHQRAVAKALTYLEETAGITRRGRGGAIKESAALVFATFQHGTSRDQDPQLHTHAILINLGLRQDGSTGALQSLDIFQEKMSAGAIYQFELSTALEQGLNLAIEPDQVGFHICGVPRELCREFSKRRRTIEQVLKERGLDDAVAAKVAALDTRKKKIHISQAELFSQWQKVSESYKWDAQEFIKNAQQENKSEHRAENQNEQHGDNRDQQLADNRNEHHGDDPNEHCADNRDEQRADNQNERHGDNRDKPRGDNQNEQHGDDRNEHRADNRDKQRADNQKEQHGDNRDQQRADNRNKQRAKKQNKTPNEDRKQNQRGAREKPKKKGWLRYEWRSVFPRAPFWSPARKLKAPVIVIGPPKKRRRYWGRILWSRETSIGELRLQKKLLFPKAPEWSPARKLEIPTLRLVNNPPQWTNLKQSNDIQITH